MDWDFSPQILIQGIDQPQAIAYLQEEELNKSFIVAGVADEYTDKTIENIPVFDLVSSAITASESISTSIIFSHPYCVLDAFYEAIASRIKQVVIYSRKIPPLDLVKLYQKAQNKEVNLLGPSEGGILIPDKYYCGINNAASYQSGNIGIINFAHQTISQEIALHLKESNLGLSTLINLGNSYFAQINWDLWLKILTNDSNTKAIVIILSQLSPIEADNLILALGKIKHKPVIIYLLDTQNWYDKINIHQAKVIADQIYTYLYSISAIELIQECHPQENVKVTDNYRDIAQIILEFD